jgi:hypothetical protein
MTPKDVQALRDEHAKVEKFLDRLRDIATAVDRTAPRDGVALSLSESDADALTCEMDRGSSSRLR